MAKKGRGTRETEDKESPTEQLSSVGTLLQAALAAYGEFLGEAGRPLPPSFWSATGSSENDTATPSFERHEARAGLCPHIDGPLCWLGVDPAIILAGHREIELPPGAGPAGATVAFKLSAAHFPLRTYRQGGEHEVSGIDIPFSSASEIERGDGDVLSANPENAVAWANFFYAVAQYYYAMMEPHIGTRWTLSAPNHWLREAGTELVRAECREVERFAEEVAWALQRAAWRRMANNKKIVISSRPPGWPREREKKDVELLSRWHQAHESGVSKKKFCDDSGIEVKALDAARDRDRARMHARKKRKNDE